MVPVNRRDVPGLPAVKRSLGRPMRDRNISAQPAVWRTVKTRPGQAGELGEPKSRARMTKRGFLAVSLKKRHERSLRGVQVREALQVSEHLSRRWLPQRLGVRGRRYKERSPDHFTGRLPMLRPSLCDVGGCRLLPAIRANDG